MPLDTSLGRSNKMWKGLVARGHRLGKELVRRLMQQHGIRARCKRKFVITTDSKHQFPIAPDLLQRNFTRTAPNQVWTGAITYTATDEGWVYLAAVIDLFSREVVGWSMQPHIRRWAMSARCSMRKAGTRHGY